MNNVFELIEKERQRQEDEICLIASENYTSKDVMRAVGSILTNKYAEGYPNKRYYGGCKFVDEIEQHAIDKCKELFNCEWANVQPHSGSQANQAVYLALLNPNNTLLGMGLDAGGHLTHGSKVSSSGKLYNTVSYGLDDNGFINYEEIRQKLYEHKPKLLVVGASAYSRIIDFESIRQIVDEYNKEYEKKLINFFVEHRGLAEITKEDAIESAKHSFNENKCLLMVDMAHIAGLVATGLHPSPLPYADVVTSTTHKTLRGPRGGIILSNNKELGKKIDKAVFPGTQGGPLEHIIAGKAICFEEALQPSFTEYQTQVLKNIKAMEEVFNERNVKMMTDGSDVHLILLDLKDEEFSGAELETCLESIGIIANKNSVKGDNRPKMETSGLRIGTACITTRGANEYDCKWIAHLICNCIEILRGTFDYEGSGLLRVKDDGNIDYDTDIKQLVIEDMKEKVKRWCETNPIYKN